MTKTKFEGMPTKCLLGAWADYCVLDQREQNLTVKEAMELELARRELKKLRGNRHYLSVLIYQLANYGN